MNDYKTYLQHDCGWFTYVPHGDVFHCMIQVCPDCGANAPNRNYRVRDDWEMFTARLATRRIAKLIWWNPLTWCDTEVILERRPKDQPSSGA